MKEGDHLFCIRGTVNLSKSSSGKSDAKLLELLSTGLLDSEKGALKNTTQKLNFGAPYYPKADSSGGSSFRRRSTATVMLTLTPVGSGRAVDVHVARHLRQALPLSPGGWLPESSRTLGAAPLEVEGRNGAAVEQGHPLEAVDVER